jgi:hypothetical protein
MRFVLRRWRTPVTSVLVLAVALATVAYAAAAANTVPAGKVGDGANSISGFVISGVHYTLNAVDPTNIDQVDFDLDSAPPAGSTIRIQLVAGSGVWYDCTNVGSSVSCGTTVPQATAVSADELRVVIAQ